MDVLEDMSNDQVNLASEIARETIANIIVATIRSKGKGWYLNLNHPKEQEEADKKMIESHMTEEQKARESWVCSICDENTFDVDWDYIGSGTNHLGCELELEMKDNKRVTKDRRKGDRRENRGDDVAKALGHMDEDGEFITEGRQEQIKVSRGVIKPKKRVKKKFYEDAGDGHMLEAKIQANSPHNDGWTRQYYKDKLAEEIVDEQEGKWIYESPDGGKTVFRRPFSNYDPKYKEEIDFKTKEPTGRMFTDWPFKDVQIDGC